MKTQRLILALFALAAGCGLASTSRAAERTSVQGILLAASNERGPIDPRLAAYEPTLRRILRFESYRFLGEDAAALAAGAKGQLDLGQGQQLEIETERHDGQGIHLRVRWLAGGRTLMNTGLMLRAGVPAVLGGPSTGKGGEVYAVILIGR
jgi:hypothetical protein